MTDSPSPREEMEAALIRNERRMKQAQTDTDVSVSQHLARIGVLGWTILTPPLAGLLIGRWLDRHIGSGVAFSALLLFAGFAGGGFSAWKWMNHPHA
ncbi:MULTISPECIES: AtpZ/AtpI family protein [Acetobacter]|uniref:ATP synthase F0 subunit I n=3 Tax=Acetobacter TaxID=434 RepID=A0A401WUE0_ACEPA|nr:AtpZ/AtpI family protein [Acetobacter pasteurianus]MCP1243788.1 AtpZ/AtpI family protein [Acetobacter lambici]GCD52937.1 ATP synthase F0 subunit I [Acetobacter pasteurianus NBRC 3188]